MSSLASVSVALITKGICSSLLLNESCLDSGGESLSRDPSPLSGDGLVKLSHASPSLNSIPAAREEGGGGVVRGEEGGVALSVSSSSLSSPDVGSSSSMRSHRVWGSDASVLQWMFVCKNGACV